MKLDLERLKRYEQKLEFIEENLALLQSWLPEDVDTFLRDIKAIYKTVQELADCTMDLVAMMVKDEGRVVKDDLTNLNTMREAGILTDDLFRKLRELNGLRNIIVHRYNRVDDRIAYESIRRLKDAIPEFTEVVRRWLRQRK